jgi:hypothetical protein
MDTGYELLAGSRTSQGDLPYIDYVYYYGPLAPFLLGAAQIVLGTPLSAAITVGLVVAVAIVFLTYAVARRLVGPLPSALAAALTAIAAFGVDNNSYILPHALSAPVGAAITLAILFAIHRRATGAGRRWAVGAGAGLGLLALARPDATLAAGAALAAWLGLRALGGRTERRAALLDAVAIAVMAAALAAAAYGPLLTGVSAHDLLRVDLFPQNEALKHSLRISAPLTAASVVKLGARLVVYAVGTGLLVAAGGLAVRDDRLGRAMRVALALVALALLAAVLVRPEAVRTKLQLAYGWIPAGALLATGAIGAAVIRRRRRFDAETQLVLALVVVLAVLGAKSYAAFYPFPERWSAQQAAYAMPFAAIFLAWLHGRLTAARPGAAAVGTAWLGILVLFSAFLVVGDAGRQSATIHGPQGSLRVAPQEAAAYQAAVDAVVAQTGPDDPIFAAPQLTWIYALTDRRPALPQLSVLPGALGTPAAERLAIARMSRVRIAVTDPRPFVNYGAGTFGAGHYDPLVGAWLRRTFRHPVRVGGTGTALDLWRRTK